MTEKLKSCPICGKELIVYGPEDWEPTFYDPDSGGEPYRAVCDCGFEFTKGHYDYRDFVRAINTRAADENPPLTYEELQNMENEPVWLIPKCGEPYWDIVRTDCGYEYPIVYFQNTRFGAYQKNGYGKTWLAYRRKPEDVN